MTYKLMQHQEEALFFLECNPSLAIYAEMGLGKTAIALTRAYLLMRKNPIDVLVVCPASLIPSWERAIEDMCNFDGVTEEDIEHLRGITIRSYQKMYVSKKVDVHHHDGQVTQKKSIELRDDVDKHWDLFIVDESHSIGAHDSIQTRSAIAISKLSKEVIIMSGTPFHGPGGKPAYEKMYGQIQVLEKGQKWKNWTQFKEELVTSVDKWFKPRTFNEERCKKIIKDHSVTYRLADCVDMPDRIEQEIPCPLAEKKAYEDIKKGNILPYNIDIETGGAQYLKLLQICSGSMKRTDDTMAFPTSKDSVLEDLLNGTDEKVVIFCNFRASVDRCIKICKKAGRNAMSFDGRSKEGAWQAFVDGKYDVIVCQYQSGGVGLNLQCAHIMVFFEPTLSSLLLEQAKGRIYRKGQEDRCVYYYLSTPKTIEARVFDSVRKGVDVSNDMLEHFAHMDE